MILSVSSPKSLRRSRPSPIRGRRAVAAFSMLEILIVMAIIGLLVALTIGNFEGIFSRSQGKVAALFVNSTIKVPLQTYRMDMGSFPTTAEGLKALISPPATGADKWQGPYIDVKGGKLPVDPWEEEYMYRSPGVKNKGSYDIWSKGPDKTDGTADDIGNW